LIKKKYDEDEVGAWKAKLQVTLQYAILHQQRVPLMMLSSFHFLIGSAPFNCHPAAPISEQNSPSHPWQQQQ
jgi:hypothetical protein